MDFLLLQCRTLNPWRSFHYLLLGKPTKTVLHPLFRTVERCLTLDGFVAYEWQRAVGRRNIKKLSGAIFRWHRDDILSSSRGLWLEQENFSDFPLLSRTCGVNVPPISSTTPLIRPKEHYYQTKSLLIGNVERGCMSGGSNPYPRSVGTLCAGSWFQEYTEVHGSTS
jgi:hypothetical protein